MLLTPQFPSHATFACGGCPQVQVDLHEGRTMAREPLDKVLTVSALKHGS